MKNNKMKEFISYLKDIGFGDFIIETDDYFKLDNGKLLIIGTNDYMKVCNYKINLVHGIYGGMRYHKNIDELKLYTSELEYIQSDDCYNDYLFVQSNDYIEEPDYKDETTRMNHESPVPNLYFTLPEYKIDDVDDF